MKGLHVSFCEIRFCFKAPEHKYIFSKYFEHATWRIIFLHYLRNKKTPHVLTSIEIWNFLFQIKTSSNQFDLKLEILKLETKKNVLKLRNLICFCRCRCALLYKYKICCFDISLATIKCRAYGVRNYSFHIQQGIWNGFWASYILKWPSPRVPTTSCCALYSFPAFVLVQQLLCWDIVLYLVRRFNFRQFWFRF